jgi:hypothetical protein
MSWQVRYFNPRLNSEETSRIHASQEGAMMNACDLLLDKCVVRFIEGPDGKRISAPEISRWCKTHRTPMRPADG